jgi:hypothetical protein
MPFDNLAPARGNGVAPVATRDDGETTPLGVSVHRDIVSPITKRDDGETGPPHPASAMQRCCVSSETRQSRDNAAGRVQPARHRLPYNETRRRRDRPPHPTSAMQRCCVSSETRQSPDKPAGRVQPVRHRLPHDETRRRRDRPVTPYLSNATVLRQQRNETVARQLRWARPAGATSSSAR